jgi:hypothetical protein
MRRKVLAGQSVLFGHVRVGQCLSQAFQLNLIDCTAYSVYQILRQPRQWTLAQAMVQHGSEMEHPSSERRHLGALASPGLTTPLFDLVHHLRLSLTRLRRHSPDWVNMVGIVIRMVGEDRTFWERECRTNPPSLSSELLHVLGVSLGTTDASMWPVTRLLAYTAQFQKCVDYVLLKRALARPLLTFVLGEARACGNDDAVKKCYLALQEL